MKITIRKVNDGFIWTVEGSTKNEGEHVCKLTEEIAMLTKIAEIVLEAKAEVKLK